MLDIIFLYGSSNPPDINRFRMNTRKNLTTPSANLMPKRNIDFKQRGNSDTLLFIIFK